MVRIVIAKPGIIAEYEASSLEYQIEDHLARIGTALGPAEIFEIGEKYVGCYRESIRRVKGIKVSLYKEVKIEHSPISLFDWLKMLRYDREFNLKLVLESKHDDKIIINSSRGANPTVDTEGCKSEQLRIIEDKINNHITFYQEHDEEAPVRDLYETAIKAISISK